MLKQFRIQKRQLERTAAAKFAMITDNLSADEADAIAKEHAAIVAQIRVIDDIITRLKDETSSVDKADGNESPADQTQVKARKKRAKKKEDDDMNDGEGDYEDRSTDDDEEDDESLDEEKENEAVEEDKGRKRKRKRKSDGNEDGEPAEGLKKPTRAMMSELVTIHTQARSLGVDIDLVEWIEDGKSPTQMRKFVFAELSKRSRSKGPQGGDGSGGLIVTRDEREGVAEAMEVALITRMLDTGRGGQRMEYKPKNLKERERVESVRKQSEQYLSYGLVDIAASCIDYRPKRQGSRYLTAHDADEIFTRAFNSTSDFPNIFQNVLNKSLLARYELHMPTYRELAVERPFNDFRPHPQIRAGEFPVLQPVTETGELKYGTSTDTGETVSVVPYGVIFTISRTMLVNDDLGAIDQLLGSAGDTVLIFENTTFFNMMLGSTVGPVLLQDSLNVFNTATHNNYVPVGGGTINGVSVTGGPPSVSNIGTARQALRAMKSISGNFLNAPPRLIVTGPVQETVADQMVTAITPTLTTSVNPFSGRLRSVSDANILDDRWYLFVEPARVPVFMYGFLNGANGPRTRTFEPFGVQGVKISLEHDFGVGAIDYRGAFLYFGH